MAAAWDQLSGESAKAYAAFCVYRDLGPRRSLDEASRRYHAASAEARQRSPRRRARASGTIRRWAVHWNWFARARAWDQESERIKQSEQHAAMQEMVERQTKEAMLLQNKAVERLRQLRPEELKPREILAYLVEAAKLERLARDEPTEDGIEERAINDLMEVTDEELARIIANGRGRLLPPGGRRVTAETSGPQEPA